LAQVKAGLKKRQHSGYTLIEVLIAMVLLVSLMFTANYSYSMYSGYWAGRLGQFDRTIFQFQGLLQTKDTIDSAIPYIVEDATGGYTFYFLGRDQGVTFVSAAPIFGVTQNDASVVRLFVEKVGAVYQLVYEEAPLADAVLIRLDQQLTFKYRLVLLSSTEPLSFSYYGWQQWEHKYLRQDYENILPTWQNSYDAATSRVQPLAMRLHIGNQVLAYQLAEGHRKLINFYLDEQSEMR
jgi:prepilin-type N-terminal cleavage/methylation domain-containing protein